MEITIKLKPYLQDYLRCTMDDQLLSNNKNLIRQMIRPFLTYRPASVPYKPVDGPEYISFELPHYEDLNIRGGNVYMPDDGQRYFEKILDAHFQSIFLMYFETMVREHGKENTKKIILQFCADYKLHFNNDFYETMKKKIYRARKSDENNPGKSKNWRLRNTAFLCL